MRILIADDNVALQEVLTEIITNADHTVEVAASIEDAVTAMDSFLPELIILDADTENGNGLTLVDRIQEEHPQTTTGILVLRSWGQQIPQDSSLIRGVVQKPFSTSDILEGIATSFGIEYVPDESKRVFKDEADDEEGPKMTLSDKGVVFGASYVMFQSNSMELFDIVSLFDNDGYDVLLVTSKKKKAITERFKKNKIETLPMTLKLMGGHFNIYRLGSMISEVSDFIKVKERPVVAFDDLNPLIERNGMNSVLTTIHQIINENYDKKVTFLVSVDPIGFTKKDKEILLNHMNNHDPSGE